MSVGVACVAIASAVAAFAISAASPVVVGGTRPGSPSVSGGRVVWADRTYGNSDIFMYDAATRSTTRLTTDTADQVDPAISGNIVVWSDRRTGKSTIYARDLSTDTEIAVSPNVSDQVRPAVSGTWVVWEDYRNNYSPAIYARDIAGGAERRIASGTTSSKRPKVAGNLIVWEDYSNAANAGDVKAYDLATGATSVIAGTAASELLAATDGRYVVWAQAAPRGMDVIAYDTVTGIRSTLTGQRGEQTFPGISGGLAYWSDNTTGQRLHADTYSLGARTVARFDDSGTSDISGLTIDGGSAAWLARRGAGWQVVARVGTGATISSLFARVAGALPLPSATSIRPAAAPSATTPLAVLSTSVRDGQTGVIRTPLRVTFTKPLDPSAGNLAHVSLLAQPSGRKVAVRVAYDRRRRSLVLSPRTALRGAYTLVVDDRVVDSTGGKISGASLTTFSTIGPLAAPTRPGVVRAKVSGLTSVTVTWNASIGAAFYDVYRSNTPTQMTDYTTQGTRVAASIAGTTTAVIAVRSDEASTSYTYNYIVVADDGAGNRTASVNALPDPHGVSSGLADTCSLCHSVHGGAATPYLGAAAATDCYRCHGSTGATSLYGANSSLDTQARFQDDSAIATGPMRTVGPAGSIHRDATLASNGHECDACHTPHRKPYDPTPSASFNRLARTQIASVVSTTNPSSAYRYNTDAAPVGNQMCFDCHGSAADNAATLIALAAGSQAYTNAGGDHRTNYSNTAHGDPSRLATPTTSLPNPAIQCLACHDEHGSAVPKLLGRFDPISGKSRITSGSVVTTLTGNDNSVCYGCHTNASTGWPNASENASGYPVRGTWPGKAIWATSYDAATHTGSFHSTATVVWSGAGEAGGDCKNCHVIHGADYQNPLDILRRDSAAATTFGSSTFAFCFKCHGAAGPASDRISRWIPQGAGGEATQTASTRYGHKTLSAGKLPAGSALPCYDCHNPHGSASAYGLAVVTQSGGTTFTVGDASGEITLTAAAPAGAVRNFCFTCHSTSNSAKGWTGSAFTTVTAPAFVEGIDRTTYNASGAHLRLPPVTGHRDSDAQSCYTCHGNDYSSAATNNVHNPGGGVSAGGQACYGCHPAYQPMESTFATRTASYHHVLGGGAFASNGDTATQPGGTGVYPSSTTDVYCISCHTDHNYFNGNKGANLRAGIGLAGSVATNTDFITGGAPAYGACVSCHGSTAIAKDTTNQKPGTGVAENAAKIVGADYDVSAHDYSMTTTFGASPFAANCSKCHDDENAMSYQTGSIGTHFSGEKHILAALGVTIQAGDEAQENQCYGCHTGAVAGMDGYGVAGMTQISRRVKDSFSLAGSKHPVTATGSGSVECQSCHNVHRSSAATETQDPANTYNNLPYSTVADKVLFCERCHGTSAAPSLTISTATYVPATVVLTQPGMNKVTYEVRAHWNNSGAIGAGEAKACGDCHDNHASAAPKLLGLYDPVTNTSYIGSQTNLTANDKRVCYGCHTSASTGYGVAAASRTASGYPVEGTWPGQAVWDTAYSRTNATGSFHSTSTVIWTGGTETPGDCKNCHDVHGTANTYDELVTTGTVNFTPATFGFCFNCHGGTVAATKDIKQFYPTEAGGSAGSNTAATRFGHKVEASSTLGANAALPCYDCHNPHGSASSYGLTIVTQNSANATITVGDNAGELSMSPTSRGALDIRHFCLTCHTTPDATNNGWGNGAIGTTVTVNAGAKVEGIDRTVYDAANKRGLKLPPVTGHYNTDVTYSCYTCHGNSYGAGGTNVHNPSGGVSTGGSPCYSCHGTYQSMEDNSGSKTGGAPASPVNSSVYHHVLGGALGDGDIAPNTGVYPTSVTDVYCVSCHTDHNYFNANKGANLRSDIGNTAGSAATNTDFVNSGTYGICLSCHSASRAKQGMGTEQASLGSTATPLIPGAEFGASAHHYTVNSSFTGSTFKADCSKCHSDEQSKTFQGTPAFGTHFSATTSILKALGVTANPPKEEACFKCHNATAAPYGETLSAAAKATQGEFGMLSHHPLDKVACVNCHNVHEASATTPAADPDNTYNVAAVNTTATINTYCLKCHDGGLPGRVVDGTKLVPYAMSANATANVGTYYTSEGHGAARISPFNGSLTLYATGWSDAGGTWTNEQDALGAPDGATADSDADGSFDMSSTFNLGTLNSIDEATLTVRSQATGGWGAPSGGTRTLITTEPAVTEANTNWTLSAGASRVFAVNYNDTTTGYITRAAGSASANQAFTFDPPNLPANATNISVSVTYAGRAQNAATGNYVGGYIRVGTGDYNSGQTANSFNSTTWGTSFTVTWTVNPARSGNTAWTPDDVNGIGTYNLNRFGVVNGTLAQAVNVTYVYLTVKYDVPNTYDDLWAIQYTTDGSSWTTMTSAAVTEPGLTDHVVDLTGILTPANYQQFAVRIRSAAIGSADGTGAVGWDSSSLAITGQGLMASGSARADCRDCHEQHGSTLRDLLRTTVGGQSVPAYSDTSDQAQCLACHRTGGLAGNDDIAQYYPAAAYGTASASMTRSGHRTKTAGTLAAGSALPCRQCHNPHGGANSGYMLSVRTQVSPGVNTFIGAAAGELSMADAQQTPANAVNIRRFCFTCHTSSDASPQGWNGGANAVVSAGCQVLGIDRTAGVLRVPTLPNGVKGHAIADSTYSCYLCHGDDFTQPTSVNVHNPASGESRGKIPCYVCHTVYRDKMEDGTGAEVGSVRTSSFHHVLGSATRQGDTTTYPTSSGPNTDVYCLSCHVDHDLFSPFVTASNKRAANLRVKIGSSAPASTVDATSTDFIAPAGSPGGVQTGSTGYATGYTDVTADWTNDANVLGASDNVVASSPADNSFEMRNTFTFPGSITSIDSAQLTVRSRANGAWGGGAGPVQTADDVATGDGTTTGWTRNTGTSNYYTYIDDAVATPDTTTYLYRSNTASATINFAETGVSIPANAKNITVAVVHRSQLSAAGTGYVAGALTYNGTVYNNGNGTFTRTNTGWTTDSTTWTVDPTGATWTATNVNNLIGGFGFSARTNTTGYQMQVTQCFIRVTYQLPTNDDTWAIQYTTDGSTWNNVVAATTSAEAALTDHQIDLTGILTQANYTNFAVRVIGTPVSTVDNAGTIDWDASTLDLTVTQPATGAGGICLSCHTAELDKDGVNQSASAGKHTPAIDPYDYRDSAHEYVATSTFTDTSTFNGNCVKCHDGEIDGGGMERGSGTTGFQTSTNKFSVHYSSAERLLAAMGVNLPPTEEAVCYKCHSHLSDGLKPVDGKDWYNKASMNATAEAFESIMTTAYAHDVASYQGLHLSSSTDETQGYISANKHVECADCHDVHRAAPGRHATGDNAVSPTLEGVYGVEPVYTAGSNWTAPTSYTATTASTAEYQICLKCHSAANTNVTSWGGAGAASWTDVGLEFNPNNGSYHPVVAALPSADPSINYGSSQLRSGTLRAAFTSGGWTSGGFSNGDKMYCSDCHVSGDAASFGPHGSGVKWMLRGPNQAWPYTTRAANGTNATTGFRLHSYMNGTMTDGPDGLFCRNCHVLPGGIGNAHGTFDKHGNMACVACHVRVPHGSKTSRFLAAIGSAATYPGNMPLRMTANGTGTNAGTTFLRYVKKPAAGSNFSEGNCTTNNCGTHGTGTITNGDASW